MFRFGIFAARAALAAGILLPSVSLAQPPEIRALSLNQIIDSALKSSSRIKQSEASLQAAKAGRSQAGALPNPELGLQIENIAGSGPYSGLRSAEMTAGVSQLIEISGKRGARIDATNSDIAAAELEQEITRADLTRDIRRAYASIVAAQEEVKLAEQQQKLASDVLSAVNQRVGAAAEPVIQQNKARIAKSSADIALTKAKSVEASAKQNLAVLIGEESTAFRLNDEAFYQLEASKPIDMTQLAKGADFQRDSAALSKTQAALSLEQATSLPDPTLSAGVRQFRDSDEKAFLVGISMPLPVFDLNRGNIERAHQETVKADVGRQLALQENQTRLVEAQQNMDAAYREANEYKTAVLPEAEKAFTQAQRGYNAGKSSYLDVLDAQRTLADTRLAYVAALKDYHFNKADIERLSTGIKGSKQ